MNNFGIICNDDVNKVGHLLFNNFKLALINIFKCNLIDIVIPIQIPQHNIKTLIIVDEHYEPNVKVWRNDEFIKTLNDNKVKVIVFNFERIHNSSFPWNVEHQKMLERINNLTQFVSDIDDAKLMNKQVINKQHLSVHTNLNVIPLEKKENKVVFIGQVNDYYPTRKRVIEQVKKILDMDVIVTDRKLMYKDFLETLNKYKYVFNPLGTGKFINLRFYEAITLGCIPIQEIRDDMVGWYPELMHSVNFTSVDKIDFDKTIVKYDNRYKLEDYLKDIKIETYFE